MMKKIGNKLLIVVFALLPIIVLDIVIGVFSDNLMPEYGSKNLELALRQAEGYRDTLNVTAHPYLTYENTKNYTKNGTKQHNNWGFRDTADVKEKKTNGVYRILTLGGSTTYGQGVSHPYEAWPKLLEEKLNNSKFTKYQVLNGGLPYGTSAELLSHYLYRYRRFSPDLVIIHLGGNDSGPLKFPNYNDEYTHWRSLKASGSNGLRPGEKFLIKNSNIMRLIYSVWYDKMNYSKEGVFSHTKGIAREKIEDVQKNVELNQPRGYEAYLSLLIRNVKNDSSDVLFFNFYGPDSTFLENGSSEALAKANYTTNFTKNYKSNLLARSKTREVAKKVCAEQNVLYTELKQGVIMDTCFIDQCHLNFTGQMVKADFIFELFLNKEYLLD